MTTFFFQAFVSGIVTGAIYALIGLGFALYLRSMRLLHFGHGEMTMIGAYLGLVLTTKADLPFLVAFPLAVTATALIGVLLERVAIRPLWVKETDPFLTRAVFATIAIGILLTNVALQIGGPFEKRYPAPLGDSVIRLGVISLVPQNLLVLGIAVLLLYMLQRFFQRTRVGLAMRAVMLDRDTAQLMGIDVRNYVALTFGLSSALAATAGILVAPLVFWSFRMGGTLGIKAFAALTLGGLYTFPGAVVGGLLVGVLESLTGLFLSSTYRDVIVFSLLILMLLIRPQGLLGREPERVV